MKNRALLLDLDDTLLHNSMDDFLPRYFRALTEAVAEHVAAEPFLQALHKATQAMIASQDPSLTNEQVFWQSFEPLLPVPRATLDPLLECFYEERFAALHGTTEPMAGVEPLIAAAQSGGWKLAIATNPVFPLRAIQHRIAWAGLEEERFDFVTAYENMRSTKPHPAYFLQIAEALGVEPRDCVMAGNHLANDLAGAQSVGMRTFWVNDFPIADADVTPDASGSLDDLRRWLLELDEA